MSGLVDLLARVDAEAAVAADARESGASDATLARVRALLDQARRLEEKGDAATAGPVLDQVAWLVTDSFRMGSELGRDLLRYAQAFRKRAARRPRPPRTAASSGSSSDPAPAARPAPLRSAPANRKWWWLVGIGAVLAVLWSTLIWAAVEFDMPALRMIASLSIAAVLAAVITALATRFRGRGRR